MDAQNAVEATSTKPSASPKHHSSAVADPQSKASVAQSPTLSRSSPSISKTAKSNASASHAHDDDDGTHDGSSDAETIVLPGKDGHSPSKSRKVIKHEDKNDGSAAIANVPASRKSLTTKDGVPEKVNKVEKPDSRDRVASKSTSAASGAAARDQRPASMDRDRGSALPGKKIRLHEKNRSKDGSSGLSSAPTSPPHHRRRRFSNAQSDSGSDNRCRSPKLSSTVSKEASLLSKDKPRSLDKQLAHKRKAPKLESDEEAESRKVRRQRISGALGDAAASGKENSHNHSGKPGKEPTRGLSQKQQEGRPTSRTRSVSPQPQPRAHRRSISTQLPPSANGMSHKKKRIPAPLQSTDYPSDDSSPNGSPHIRSSKLRNLATPATTESNMSPAKHAMPHKKHLDAHGQTYLARACARGELEHAKQRLGERPEDLNVADFAGNTPLQIAALHGFHEIVQLLIDAGCQLDCVNNDKDTPLLDAVDNGHLKVVKILLNAGVNPRKANVNGEEPIERVDLDSSNGDEIRAALLQAKKRTGDQLRASEDRHDHDEAHDSHDPDNPRRSPGTGSSSLAGTSRRSGTVRANKTSNHQLYLSLDAQNLRQAAGRGQLDTVTRILEVISADAESMVAAARGGHDMVMQMLLALGDGNPDAAPVPSIAAEHATPMLAAIGQENIKIIRLLLDQSNFDPTRRFKGETYYEIARRRQGLNWKEEEQLLKDAYDAYRKSHKDGKTKSPAKRDQDRETRRAGRLEPKSESSGSHKRKASSPHETIRHKAPTSPNEKRRSNSFSQNASDQTSPKRGPGRPKKDERIPNITISDREGSPTPSKHSFKSRKTDLDAAPVSSDGETPKPRRKLVSGRDLKKESEKQRRASMASTSTVGLTKEGSSPRDSRHDDVPEKQKLDKTLDRTKQLKRDDSRDRATASDGAGNRHRASATPPHPGISEKDGAEGATKKRRLDSDAKDVKERKKQKTIASTDDRPLKASSSRELSTAKTSHKERDDEGLKPKKLKKREPSSDRVRRESGKSATSEKSIYVRSEEPDTEMPDAVDPPKEPAETDARAPKDRDEGNKKAEETEKLAAETKKKDEETKRRDAEEKEKKRKLAEEEAKRKDLEDKKAREEQERKKQEEEETRRQEELECKRKEGEEKKRREEEEQQRREAAEKKRRAEDEERKKREEEAELLRREAAAEARRKLEEEQRKEEERREEERKERLQREEERRRAAREAERTAKEAEQRRLFEEKEQLRLAKLPYLLRWLDQCDNPKTPEHAELFRAVVGVRASCLRPELEGTVEGREPWILNAHVALLLGEKDLTLSRFTAWERIPAPRIAKKTISRWSSGAFNMQTFKHEHLARSMGYFHEPKSQERNQAIREHNERFLALDMFFVKLSDFMFMVPSFPHLRNVKMEVCYQELSLDENRLSKWPDKWKNDPTPEGQLKASPPNQLYINGQLQGVLNPLRKALVSTAPFPEDRGPRRGLTAVARDDPDYDRLCLEQGLPHLVQGSSRPSTSSDGGHSAVTAVNGSTGVAFGLKTAPPFVNGDHRHQDAATTSEIDSKEPNHDD